MLLYDAQLYLASLKLLVDLDVCHALANGMWTDMMKGEDWNVLLHLVLSSWSSAIAMKRLRPDSLLVSEEFKGMCSRPHPNESWSQTQRTPPKCQTSHNCINEKWCSLLEAMEWEGFLIKIIVSIAHSLGCHVKKLIYRKSKWGILSEIFKRLLAEYLSFYWQETDWKKCLYAKKGTFFNVLFNTDQERWW